MYEREAIFIKRVMVIMGTRPEAIKLCPVVKELQKREDLFETVVASSGQHKVMLDGALKAFSVKPDLVADVMQEGQGLSDLPAQILRWCDGIFHNEHPDLVLVQGDTATAYAAGLAAFYNGIPVGHVEAGLRTYQIKSPFPEEYHRRALALLATYHFAPTVHAKRNLEREGVPSAAIHITGNTVVDALRYTLNECRPPIQWQIPKGFRLVLFTAHRRESLGTPLCGMLKALRRVVDAHPDVIAVFPIHHNPMVRKAANEILCGAERIRMIKPPEFVAFHHLLSKAYLVMTDSGGIQEEAASLGIPTLVMRYSSERAEGIRAGVLKLAGSGEEGIFTLADRLLTKDSDEYLSMRRPSSVYGDGHAASRIVDFLVKTI